MNEVKIRICNSIKKVENAYDLKMLLLDKKVEKIEVYGDGFVKVFKLVEERPVGKKENV